MVGPSQQEIAYEILTYVLRHPNAQDTLEGIAEWWVVERDRERRPRDVRAAVDSLVEAGFLVATRGRDQRERYHVNVERREEAASLLDRRAQGDGERKP